MTVSMVPSALNDSFGCCKIERLALKSSERSELLELRARPCCAKIDSLLIDKTINKDSKLMVTMVIITAGRIGKKTSNATFIVKIDSCFELKFSNIPK